MPMQNQLEVIAPNGDVKFYELDPTKGVINIGRYPENDVVIDRPGVASFHAVIDYRQRPYHLIILSHEGETRLSGKPVPPNVSTKLNDWDVIELEGYTLIIIEGQAAPQPSAPPPVSAPPPPTPSGVTVPVQPIEAPAVEPEERPSAPPETRPVAPPPTPTAAPPQAVPVGFRAPVPTTTDDRIITEITEQEWLVNVEETAVTQLTIINGGPLVASFNIEVQGIDKSWVIVSPATVNLYEGDRTTVGITITPSRAPTSRAGKHYLAIVVTSPDYPGRVSQIGATLEINPYYQFSVSELSPKRQTISWSKGIAEASLSVLNKGNSRVPYQLNGQDDERGCSFEFKMPDQDISLANQAECYLAPQESIPVTVFISPLKRQLFSLRKKMYSFTITARPLEGEDFPLSLLGQLAVRSLFGFIHLVLAMILLAIGIYALFQPRVTEFYAEPTGVRAGHEVVLNWDTFPAPLVSLDLLSSEGEQDVEAHGLLVARPIEDSVYSLSAHTWLSDYLTFLPYPQRASKVEVKVTPVMPSIRLFDVSREQILEGDAVILSWLVSEAADVGGLSLYTEVDGEETELKLEENVGSMAISPKQDTNYRLEAIHPSSPNVPAIRWASVAVATPVTPTPTPAPPPIIDYFSVEPKVITPGGSVNLSWSVRGVDTVSVQEVSAEPLPAVTQDIIHSPEQTTLYVLTANNGVDTVQALQQVTVTSAPEPAAAPVIEVFVITPDEGVQGEEVDIRLDWFVTGDTTNIVLSGGPEDFEPMANLKPLDNTTIDNLKETALFVLTAYNGETKTTKTAQIQFLEPTPTPEPTEAAPTATPAPEALVLSFTAEGLNPPTDEVTYVGGDPDTYNVVAGSDVDIKWETENAETVTLVGIGEQATSGNYTVFDVKAGQTFQLTVEGIDNSTDAFLKLQIQPPPAPPPPYNLNGAIDGDTINLTWNYDTQYVNDIIGFRIYRADVPPGNFTRVADENTLTNLTTQWTDTTLTETCGKGYYIVAVYEEFNTGEIKETNASRYSWYTDPC